MKFTIAMLALVLTVNVHAFELQLTTMSQSTGTVDGAGRTDKVQARAVLADVQSMLNTGDLSIFLSQKIQEIQTQNNNLSEAEALDILIESAQTILSK